ncbi:MAG TPA: biotin carboxylase N-terminal domain-containing protein, partial [Bacteroidota bacterium]
HRILDIARQADVDAIHPGYGFLSENADFAEAVRAAGIVFIGPSAAAMRLLGDKTAARKIARQCGVPTIAGTEDALRSENEGIKQAQRIGFPVLLKAAGGGGGKGMRVVSSAADFGAAFTTAQSEAKSAFGDGRVYLEKYIEQPRHVEIQILADRFGNTIYLGERECSIQRRHQKVLEESPSPIITPELRREMGEAAVKVAKVANYSNAGTVEFLVDLKKNFYFLEVNTRLQVEHPVTEAITGLDLVKEQISIAEGEKLQKTQEGIELSGHALECRIYAEDPQSQFFPSTGRLERYDVPSGPRVRVDSGFRCGDTVSVYYDPLLAKVITWGNERGGSIAAMQRALSEFRIEGVKTTIPFCQFVLGNENFQRGDFDTHFVRDQFDEKDLFQSNKLEQIAAAVGAMLALRDNQPHRNGSTNAHSDNLWKRQREESYR